MKRSGHFLDEPILILTGLMVALGLLIGLAAAFHALGLPS